MTRVERVCVCIDTCVDLYVLVGIAVSCMGAWDGVMMYYGNLIFRRFCFSF